MSKYVRLIDQEGETLGGTIRGSTLTGDPGFDHLPRQGETLILSDYDAGHDDKYTVEAVEHEVQATPAGLLSQGAIVRVSWVSRVSRISS